MRTEVYSKLKSRQACRIKFLGWPKYYKTVATAISEFFSGITQYYKQFGWEWFDLCLSVETLLLCGFSFFLKKLFWSELTKSFPFLHFYIALKKRVLTVLKSYIFLGGIYSISITEFWNCLKVVSSSSNDSILFFQLPSKTFMRHVPACKFSYRVSV